MWLGDKHTALYGVLRGLGELWRPVYWVVDKTGVGAGLTSFLDAAFPEQVIPFNFTQATKSQLGWGFLAIVETGRFKDYKPQNVAGVAAGEAGRLHEMFLQELAYCQHEIKPGVARVMSWGVPDGTRATETGELVHDDLIISAALCVALEEREFTVTGPPSMVRAADPLDDMRAF